MRKDLEGSSHGRPEDVVDLALRTIRSLDIPHLELIETGDEIVH